MLTVFDRVLRERDALRAEIEQLRQNNARLLGKILRERDALHAEVGRLRKALSTEDAHGRER